MDRNAEFYSSVENSDKLAIDTTKNRLCKVIFDNSMAGEKSIELSRFNLDENYQRLFRNIIFYLINNRYEVDGSIDTENLKLWERGQYFNIFFRKRKSGLFSNKPKYGVTHTLWIGYTGDMPLAREVGFKIDGKPYAPVEALQEIDLIVRKRR